MRELTPLFELNEPQASEAFEEEILGPMLGLGLLDDENSASWDLVSVMSRLYRAKRQFTKPRLIEMTGVPRGATLEDLERTVLQRAHAPRRQGISPPLDHDDLDIVHHWLDRRKRDRKLRQLSRAVFGIFKGSDPADAVLRNMVAELARAGELVKARARDPRAMEPVHAGGPPPAEPARRTDAPAFSGAKPTPPVSPRQHPAPDATTSAPPTRPAVERVTTPPPTKRAEESVTPPAPPKPVVVSAPTPTPTPAPPEPAAESAPPPAQKPAVESEPTPAPPKRPLPAAILATPDSARIRARVERDLSRPPLSAAKPAILELELAFSQYRVGESPGIVVVPELAEGHELWFIGDMHGDLVSFEAALQHVASEGAPDCTIVFLGDVVDDGFHSYELILRLFEEIAKAPGRYVLLAGNHDEALAAHGEGHATQFTSSVDPSEFSIWLNRELSTPGLPQDQALQIIEVARLFQNWIARAPRALFFPGGLFAAHGGFPHSDLWDSLETPEAMTAKNCLNDFVWNRWSDQSAKFPNRMSSQSQFGARDFLGFCERATKIMGRSVSAMVRGHDHIVTTKARFERKEDVRRASYEGRILTVNNMCFTMPREVSPFAAPDPHYPVLARWRFGADLLPTPVVLELPAELVSWYAPRCATCGRPNETRSVRCALPAQSGDGLCGGEVLRRDAS